MEFCIGEEKMIALEKLFGAVMMVLAYSACVYA